MKDIEEYLEAGTYRVRVTLCATLRIENDHSVKECDLMDEAVNDPSVEFVDYEVEKIR